jgi:hypothetical protein
MDESSAYNDSDLAPFRQRFNDLRTIIKSDSESGKHPEAMTKLLERQLWNSGMLPISSRPPLLASHHALESVLNRMQDNLSVLSDELLPLHEQLIIIKRKLVELNGLAAKGGVVTRELRPLRDELRKINWLSTSCFRLEVWSAQALFLPLSHLLPLDPFHTWKQRAGTWGDLSTKRSSDLAAVFLRHKPYHVPHFWKNALILFRRFVPRKNQSMSPHRSNPFMTASPGSVRSLRALR